MLPLWQFLFVFLLSLNLQEVPANPENNGMFFTLLHKGEDQNILSFHEHFFPIMFLSEHPSLYWLQLILIGYNS